MKIVYVAGPFRGTNSYDMECNIRRAEALALDVWRTGFFAALCPHANTRFFQGAAQDKIWLEGDLEMLRRCDAVVLTPDWKRSSGARVEVREALKCKIPVFPDVFELVHWYRQLPSIRIGWSDLAVL